MDNNQDKKIFKSLVTILMIGFLVFGILFNSHFYIIIGIIFLATKILMLYIDLIKVEININTNKDVNIYNVKEQK